MNWTTIAWSMGTSACLTLAILHLVIWCKQTDQWAHLLFSVTSISVAAIAAAELLIMHASSPEQLGQLLWWAQVPVFFTVVSIVGFVRLYFNAGRSWLGSCTPKSHTGLGATYSTAYGQGRLPSSTNSAQPTSDT